MIITTIVVSTAREDRPFPHRKLEGREGTGRKGRRWQGRSHPVAGRPEANHKILVARRSEKAAVAGVVRIGWKGQSFL